MTRIFRIFEKKRGQRRTGSTMVGRIWEAAFFGVLFLLGAASLANLLVGEILQPSEVLGLGYWLLVLAMASFVLIGGAGVFWAVFHSGTSVERRAAIVKRAHSIDLVTAAVPLPLGYPTLPDDNNLTNSPGVVLAYRLPTSESPIWGVLAATVFSLAWNGVSAVLTVWATRSWSAGEPEWLLSFLLLPAHAVGAWSIYYFLRQFIVHTTLGPTIVEVSNHPLYPGGRYELLLSQTGNVRLQSLEVSLVCEEEATYHQGTDIRHECRRVFEQKLLHCRDLLLDPGATFENLLPFAIPAGAMHSFFSAHNSVNWKIVVRGEAENWPPVVRIFPLIIYPLKQQSPPPPMRAAADHPTLSVPLITLPLVAGHEVSA